MAYANPRPDYRQAPLEPKRAAYFDDDDQDSAILDPAILDSDAMQSPSQSHFRKDSFANSNGVLSPAESQGWEHQQFGGLPIEAGSAPTSLAFRDDHGGYRLPPPPGPHPAPYGHQHQPPPPPPSWGYDQGSGTCTPTTGVDFLAAHSAFEHARYIHPHRPDGAPGTFHHPPPPPPPFDGSRREPAFVPAPQVQTPMSPHSHQDWMGMAQQEMECRPLPKRMRPNSPPTTMVDFARRDGIRKKNGRIDIPHERNIHTIDDMIDQTTDEDLLKELKQQKRLLRNREAALASRQRKKKHTEELEVKEKGYAQQIAMLEKSVSDLSIERQAREEERQMLLHRFQESQRAIDTLQEQIKDLKMQHNEETSTLRKRVNILTDQLDAGAAPAMSAVPSSAGFTDFNAEMEALHMGPHDWDNFIFVNDLQDDAEDFAFAPPANLSKAASTAEKKPSAPVVVPTPAKKPSEAAAADQPIASGLLFMLLLCGAFVASKPVSSQPRDMPQMPADVRAAAPTVLNSLLSEAGPTSQTARPLPHADRHGPTLDTPHAHPRAGGSASSGSRLDRMHHHLTSPTKQQEIDQAFALTTAQYASMTNPDYPAFDNADDDDDDSGRRRAGSTPKAASRPRRNLAGALANLQPERAAGGGGGPGGTGKAEVYTRSLLWDQIPRDIVKQFREMVRDHEEIEARQRQQQQQQQTKKKQKRRPSAIRDDDGDEEMAAFKAEG